MNEFEKRWISKYALTRGVYCTHVERNNGYISERTPNGRSVIGGYFEKAGAYDFDTAEEALEHAEVLRAKKIDSLEEQLNKLHKLEIRVFHDKS